MCKSPLTGKNGRVYFLDILEHSRKPELDLVGQWRKREVLGGFGAKDWRGQKVKGRLTFSEVRGVLGRPRPPG